MSYVRDDEREYEHDRRLSRLAYDRHLKRLRLGSVALAGAGWLVVATVAVLGLTPAVVALGAVASAATVTAALYDILPSVVGAWQMGVDYGRNTERLDIKAGVAPDPLGPGLRVVRARR